ncbi:MAG: VRR-NUC domain-containing protein [Bacteroidia bacterium]|nr:VRR-NUC domain-containing protein [Chitinophagaceae bacterium]MCZ2356678.1 VRR-NUC domain-containing protein [Bacteroidia bacterium]
MVKTESDLQRQCIDWLRREHPAVYARKIIVANRAGTPDLLMCIRGRFVAIEFKTEGGKQTALQKYNEQQIKQAGGKYSIVMNLEKFKSEIEKWQKENIK